MSEPVVISLVSEGVAKLHAELRTIDQTIAEMERRSTRAAEAGARQRTNVARQAANDQTRIWRDTAKQAEAWEKQKAQIAENSARMAGRLAEKQARDEISAAERAERSKIRSAERSERERQRIIDNSARMAGRIAEREANAEIAAMKRVQEARARFLGGMGGRVSSSVGRVAQGGLTMLGMSTTLGAGYAVASAMRDEVATERQAQILSNTAVVPGAKGYSKKELIELAGATARTTNFSKSDLLGGLQAFTDISGDLEGGVSGMGFAAKVAKGQGADFKEVMQTLGTLRVQNPHLDQGGLENMLSAIVGGARIGAISSAEMASQAGRITSSAGSYAGDQATAQRHLLGMAQLVRPVTGGADESATAVTRMASDLASNRGKIQGAGIDVFKKGTNQLRDLSELVPELMKATGGDVGKLKHLGIGRESMEVFNAVRGTFNAAGGGEAGAKAAEGEIKKFENASVSAAEIEKNFEDVMQTASERFEHASLVVQEILEQKLAPWIDRLAEKLPELEPKFEQIFDGAGKLAEWFLSNPLQGVGDVVLAATTKDIASAMIGQGIKKALETSIGGMAGTGLAIATAAITAEQVGELVINQLAQADTTQNRHEVGQTIGATNALSGLHRPGGPTPKDIANARKTVEELTATVKQERADYDGSFGGNVVRNVSSVFNGEAVATRERMDAANLAANEKALAELTKALNEATRAYGAGGAGGTGGARGPDFDARNKPLGTGGSRQH